MSFRIPKFRLHKPSGQAVVSLDGRDVYLGPHDDPKSRAEYDRLIAEWLVNGRRVAMRPGESTDLTVAEVLRRYLLHCDDYYRTPDGRPSKEAINMKAAMRPVRELYAHTRAAEFGPLALKAVRERMIKDGLCRNEVNKRVRRVVRAFKWAVECEIVPPSVHHGLKAVAGLRRGRSAARESDPVRPVADALVDAIRPYVAPQVWTMIQLQRYTGARPGEVLSMRTCDVDRSGRVWTYRPERHKTAYHGHERTIYIGPRAQEILRPWLRPDLTAYLFQPAEAEDLRNAAKRAARKSPMTPSQRARKSKRNRRRPPADQYTVDSYRRAITYGCRWVAVAEKMAGGMSKRDAMALVKEKGFLSWHPHQLRHSAATWLRKEFGLDVARVVLGHRSPAVTEVYAEVDQQKALDVMARVG